MQSHNAAVRSERTYLEILTPRQSVLFYKWMANNNGRCRDALETRTTSQRASTPTSIDYDSNLTLIEVCRKLEAVLKISKGGNEDSANMVS